MAGIQELNTAMSQVLDLSNTVGENADLLLESVSIFKVE